MTRPLMQFGVGNLEALFAKSKTDANALRKLEHELQYRQVPRAVALLAEVQAAISGITPGALAPVPPESSRPPAPQQTGLMQRTATPATGSVTLPIVTPQQGKPIKPPAPLDVPKTLPPTQSVMPVDDAYKLLKATTSSTWESIEQNRRQMVMNSSPLITRSMSEERRSQLLAQAKLVNAAYAVLSAHQTGNR